MDDTHYVLLEGRLAAIRSKRGKKDKEASYQIHTPKWRTLQKGILTPYLRCVEQDEARYILEEVHEGVCGDHSGPRSLVITRVGYFWPTMQKETKGFVKRCDKCQKYGNVQQIPGEKMMIITSSWLFAQWGIDIVGPLPYGNK